MNNNKIHEVEKSTIINAKQCLIKLHRSSVTTCRADKNPYRHDGRADKDTYRHDGRAYNLSLYVYATQQLIITTRYLFKLKDL